MFRSGPFLAPTRLLLIAGLLLPGVSARADNKPVAPPGYHLVGIQSAKGVGYLAVKDESKGGAGADQLGTPDPNHPEEFNFGATSSFAHKGYDLRDDGSSSNSSSYQQNVQRSFVTKSYFANHGENAADTVPGLDKKVPVSAFGGFDQKAGGYDKKFATTSASDDQHKTAGFAMKTSSDQGRKAQIGGHTIETYANPMGSQTYNGPETKLVKRDLNQMNQGLESLKDLPSRPLTIDEVRALINHGVEPDLNEKPAPPSKPLNDPTYMPDPEPGPVQERTHPAFRDDDGVPAPGTMAHPENTEPLPQ